MTTEYSALIRNLARDHFEGRISMVEYRARRKAIIDRMDRQFNGFDSDSTQPRTQGFWADQHIQNS